MQSFIKIGPGVSTVARTQTYFSCLSPIHKQVRTHANNSWNIFMKTMQWEVFDWEANDTGKLLMGRGLMVSDFPYTGQVSYFILDVQILLFFWQIIPC